MVGGLFIAVLYRYLHVIETGITKRGKRLRRETDRRCDQVAVKARITCRLGDFWQVAPRRGLTSGQMDLQNAKRGRFPKNPRPGRGVELVVAPVERQRIRAVGTAERTAMREFGKKTEGRWHCIGRGHL
jgi:hypothetical protein